MGVLVLKFIPLLVVFGGIQKKKHNFEGVRRLSEKETFLAKHLGDLGMSLANPPQNHNTLSAQTEPR